MTRPAREKTLRAPGDVETVAASFTIEDGPGLRVLVVSHSHPEISKGGAEIAAFQLFLEIQARPDCEAWFLGCDRRRNRSDIPISQPFGPRDFLYSAQEFDWFKFANRDPRFPEAFANLLMELRPNVVHFHHYMGTGVEAFALVRRTLPDALVFVTLHEYLAICSHHGQMVTKPHRNLCYQASPQRCAECFPEVEESDFFLRKRYIAHFFDFVDHFVSPSLFLADRYIAWGIAPDRISVIENLVRTAPPLDASQAIAATGPLRVGFFGQLSFLKGANVLFEVARLLDNEERDDIRFEIFGDYRSQPPEFQKELQERMETLGPNVGVHGPYDEPRVDMLMRSVDIIIVPSVWWENSPLVIQEAYRNGRPVICSNIGGMAEKVRDGVDGFQFYAGSALDLTSLLKRLADDRSLVTKAARTLRKPVAPEVIIDAHRALYRRLMVTGPPD